MQAYPLTSSHSHAHLQALQSIQPMHSVPTDPPALATQQDVDALVAKPRPTVRKLTNAQA